jgi:hypothetical protein
MGLTSPVFWRDGTNTAPAGAGRIIGLIASASLIVSVLALLVAAAAYRHSRDHDQLMASLAVEHNQREKSQVWEVHATGPGTWSLDTQRGLIQAMTAEVMNAGRLDSAFVRVRAIIDGDLVGESSAQIIAGGTIAAEVVIPMRGEVPSRAAWFWTWSIRAGRC